MSEIRKKEEVSTPPSPLYEDYCSILKRKGSADSLGRSDRRATRTESDTRRATRELFLRRATDRSFLSRLGRTRPFLTTTPLHSGLVSDLRGSEIRAPRPSETERARLPLAILSYIRMNTIVYFSCQYYFASLSLFTHAKKKPTWMYLSISICLRVGSFLSSFFFIFYFLLLISFFFFSIYFCSFLQRETKWCLECQGQLLPQRHYCLSENGHLLPFQSRACE